LTEYLMYTEEMSINDIRKFPGLYIVLEMYLFLEIHKCPG